MPEVGLTQRHRWPRLIHEPIYTCAPLWLGIILKEKYVSQVLVQKKLWSDRAKIKQLEGGKPAIYEASTRIRRQSSIDDDEKNTRNTKVSPFVLPEVYACFPCEPILKGVQIWTPCLLHQLQHSTFSIARLQLQTITLPYVRDRIRGAKGILLYLFMLNRQDYNVEYCCSSVKGEVL